MGDFTRCKSSVDRGSGAERVAAPAPVDEDDAPATMISGKLLALGAVNTAPDEGFFSLIRRPPREYSNSSRLCSVMIFRSSSIWSMSGPTDDPPPLDITRVLRFIFTSGFVKQTLKPTFTSGFKEPTLKPRLGIRAQ